MTAVSPDSRTFDPAGLQRLLDGRYGDVRAEIRAVLSGPEFAPAIASCCLLAGLGNVVCAVSPSFAGVLVGRGVVGLGGGLAFVIGPVVARAHGGARTVGLAWDPSY